MDDNDRNVRPARADDIEQLRPLLGKSTHHLPGLEMFLRPLPGDEGYLPDAFVAVTATGEVIGYAELNERGNTAELHEPVMLRGQAEPQLEQLLRQALEREAKRRRLRVVRLCATVQQPSAPPYLSWIAFLIGLTLGAAALALGFLGMGPPWNWNSPAVEWQIGFLFGGGLLLIAGVRGAVRSLSDQRFDLPRGCQVIAVVALVGLVLALLAAVWYFRLVAAVR